jgi:beta-lactamase class A
MSAPSGAVRKLAAFLLLFACGLGSGIWLSRHLPGRPAFQLERLYPHGGHLINPLLQVEGPPGGDATLNAIKRRLDAYIAQRLKAEDASRISVYLRTLDKGTWIGVHEDEPYAAASLAKVPVMIAVLMTAQHDSALLSKPMTYDTEIVVPAQQNITPGETLQLGQVYTVEDLLRHMIAYSENAATFLLASVIDQGLIDQVYSDVRLPLPKEDADYQISAKICAKYFRILYSASYLNRELSEKALRLLTETDFRDGLVAGVPAGVAVAHKYAERGKGPEGQELHDAGIVYAPTGAYLLCVMTEGWGLNPLKQIIQTISRMVYEQMTDTQHSVASAPR